jgi:SagB-type dehydrogenase family enzyme
MALNHGSSPPWYVVEGERGEQLLEQGLVEPARAVFEAMLARLGSAPTYARAVALGRVAHCWHVADRIDEAVRYLREALGVTAALPPSDGLKALRGTLRSDLGDALRAAGQFGQARQAYEAALAITRERHDVRGEAVELGRLGALAAAEGNTRDAASCFESARRLFEQVGDTRQLARCLDALTSLVVSDSALDVPEFARHAPVIFGTLARLGAAPSYGRAVLLGHLGRCWWVAGRLHLALASIGEALGVIAALPPSDDVSSLCAFVHLDLGDMFRADDREAEAVKAYETALTLANELQDVTGRAVASERLGRTADERRQNEAPPLKIIAYDHLSVDHVFDPDLLIEGPRQRRILQWAEAPLADDVTPVLVPSARAWVDEARAIWFSLPFAEPQVQRGSDCTVFRRRRREVQVLEDAGVVWRVTRALDGSSTLADALAGFTPADRAVAVRLLGALAATGVVDVSGRPLGRFLHLATKKGVLPGGGLEAEAVLRLATDGNYRGYPDVPRMAVRSDVPEPLRAFHTLTRSRRSTRDYRGASVPRADFEALLHTACGVTGSLEAAGRRMQLRAYPSSGALYAVEIYPVVFRVEGLEPAVFHYRALENVLEVVRPGINPSVIVRAALPVEREMVAGAAALVCLTGCFPRHERKYGEGGYRMLVAEAGHISQNLILAATALGLSARPFGGVFDDLVNQDLGIDGIDEQFLLAVLVGKT